MSIKLIKISKDLNVGLSTIVDYLHSKGFDVESNPNVKVTGEQYEMVVREFGKESDVEALLNRKKTTAKKTEEQDRPKDENLVTKTEEKKEEKPQVLETVIPEDKRPQIQVVDKIDLDALNRRSSKPKSEPTKKEVVIEKKEVKKAVEEKPIEKQKPVEEEKKVEVKKVVPKVEEAKEAVTEDVQSEKEGSDDEVFRLRDSSIETNIVVKGTIDLSAINDRTRPARKSKAEKKKERQDREQQDPKKVKESKNTTLIKKDAVDEKKKAEGDDEPKRRKRIKKGKVDVEKGAQQGTNKRRTQKPAVQPKAEVTEEDVQKQIKETLARLSSKKGPRNKGAKYRKERREAESLKQEEQQRIREKESKTLQITEFVTVSDLANMMDVPAVQVISTCMSLGMMVSINQRIDAETINFVAEEFGFKTEYVSAEVIEAIAEEVDAEEDLISRPPIVTVMGHVDHGKTSLLDNIRQANVIAGEAGGITQHIGAYNVKIKSGRRITFLDTPGHEAFTAMRARGAQVTDVAIIIVAADDDVMPQTKEAINHAAAAGVPIVFAINKIDKPAANPDKIKETLASMNYLIEEWGGKYQSQDISAKQGLGVNELLEKVLLEADILDLKANPNRKANGSVIESSLDKGRGYLSTILVQNGTLKVGDVILAGTHMGRVKALFNERNQSVTSVLPASPAVILGLNGAPQAGDAFNVLDTEQEAREIAGKREQLQREQNLRTQRILTLDDIGRRIAIGNFQQLNVIVKGDVDGSVEALSDSLLNLSTEEIQVNVIHKGVGQISESDVTLATASDAIIIGFQVRPSVAARKSAEADGIDIRLYSIIYNAIEEVRAAMEGMLSPEIKEIQTGYVEVREVFKITKVGTVAGCYVSEGKLKRANKVRIIRDGIVVYSGELGSLKRFKDDVKEVAAGLECGLNIHNFNDIKAGDIIEPFEEVEVKKTL